MDVNRDDLSPLIDGYDKYSNVLKAPQNVFHYSRMIDEIDEFGGINKMYLYCGFNFNNQRL
jgi:hypothetical protein